MATPPSGSGEPRPGTVVEVLRAAEGYLAQRQVDAPLRSAELLMGQVLGLPRLELYLDHDRPLSATEKSELRALIARRGEHEPLAYLLGDWEFYGHTIEVDPAVLIPRSETEGLVELALAKLVAGGEPRPRVVDLGTGSGAIAVAVALECPAAQVVAVDVSPEALAVAQRNVARHDLDERLTCRLGSYWDAVPADELGFDVCVSNPPYVDPALPELVADDVLRYEPGLALWTPAGDPAAHYVEILAGIEAGLRSGGWLLVETGVGAVDEATAAFEACGHLTEIAVTDDLSGLPRYLSARRI